LFHGITGLIYYLFGLENSLYENDDMLSYKVQYPSNRWRHFDVESCDRWV